MNPSKLLGKKNKKRKNSDDNSSQQEYQGRRTGKLRKHSKMMKQKQGEPKKKSQKLIVDKYGLQISSESDSNLSNDNNVRKSNYIPIQIFNANKIFAQILNKANKQPDFLIMLKNLLSGCSRSLTDKKNMFKKKWKQLRNSNCSQEQYLNRQAELKRAQFQQIHQMQRDIMVKLSYANIKGFQTRHSLIDNYKKQHKINEQNSQLNGIEYQIQDQIWQKYYEQQRRLLDLLMKQNDFVSQDYTPSNLIKTYSEPLKDKEQNIKDQVFQDNQIGVKFNNIQTEQNPQSTQFFFCKQFKDINYDRVFSNGMNSFKLHESQKYFVEPKAMGLLLQTKSDEIYTNERFQRQKYKKYSELLKQIYDQPQKFQDSQIISHILQVGAYILNAVHYYQKFKLKCQLLHPLDLQLVIQKIKRIKRNGVDDGRLDKMEEQLDQVVFNQYNIIQEEKY